jgi:hypothetical protein
LPARQFANLPYEVVAKLGVNSCKKSGKTLVHEKVREKSTKLFAKTFLVGPIVESFRSFCVLAANGANIYFMHPQQPPGRVKVGQPHAQEQRRAYVVDENNHLSLRVLRCKSDADSGRTDALNVILTGDLCCRIDLAPKPMCKAKKSFANKFIVSSCIWQLSSACFV